MSRLMIKLCVLLAIAHIGYGEPQGCSTGRCGSGYSSGDSGYRTVVSESSPVVTRTSSCATGRCGSYDDGYQSSGGVRYYERTYVPQPVSVPVETTRTVCRNCGGSSSYSSGDDGYYSRTYVTQSAPVVTRTSSCATGRCGSDSYYERTYSVPSQSRTVYYPQPSVEYYSSPTVTRTYSVPVQSYTTYRQVPVETYRYSSGGCSTGRCARSYNLAQALQQQPIKTVPVVEQAKVVSGATEGVKTVSTTAQHTKTVSNVPEVQVQEIRVVPVVQQASTVPASREIKTVPIVQQVKTSPIVQQYKVGPVAQHYQTSYTTRQYSTPVVQSSAPKKYQVQAFEIIPVKQFNGQQQTSTKTSQNQQYHTSSFSHQYATTSQHHNNNQQAQQGRIVQQVQPLKIVPSHQQTQSFRIVPVQQVQQQVKTVPTQHVQQLKTVPLQLQQAQFIPVQQIQSNRGSSVQSQQARAPVQQIEHISIYALEPVKSNRAPIVSNGNTGSHSNLNRVLSGSNNNHASQSNVNQGQTLSNSNAGGQSNTNGGVYEYEYQKSSSFPISYGPSTGSQRVQQQSNYQIPDQLQVESQSKDQKPIFKTVPCPGGKCDEVPDDSDPNVTYVDLLAPPMYRSSH